MMKLSYRGISYTTEPPTVEQMESSLIGSYRGCGFQFGYPRHIPATHPVATLSYRGVPYRTTATGEVRPVQPAQPRALRDLTVFRDRKAQDCDLQALSAVHNRNLYQMLERRIQAARAKGDQTLLEQLEQERRQMV